MSSIRVAIAGSTGSVGTQTIDVIRDEPERYEVVALGVGSSVDALIAQANEFRPKLVAVADPLARRRVADALPFCTVVDDLAELTELADVVVNGVVGFAGLSVTLATLAAGKRLALANKESLIAAGPIVQPLRKTPGAELVPVDSEHCAVDQCLRASIIPHGGHELERIVLTASGGPFRGRTLGDLADITVEQAMAHPTWNMGPKITIDSSTLMNKGLEVIEAHELFGASYEQIEVVVHPQSIVHSMVEFTDGATIAQLSTPNMRHPIAYALAYPDRGGVQYGRIDWSALRRLDFEPPDFETFRCLALAYQAGRQGGSAPAWLNAANEVAVEGFLRGVVRWVEIPTLIDATLQHHDGAELVTADDVVEADRQARAIAAGLMMDWSAR